MRIAFASVGIPSFGHNVSFPPAAIAAIAASVYRHFGDSVSGRLFDEVLLGHEGVKKALERFRPEALLISVPVSGYYASAVKLAGWASARNIPVLLGGYHFTIPGSGTMIPQKAAERLRVPICCGQGEETAVRFVERLFDPAISLRTIPNLCVWDEESGRTEQTRVRVIPLDCIPFPALPLSWHDPRAYWKDLRGGDVQESGKDTLFDGRNISRTIVGPRTAMGCRYRTARLRSGKSHCSYCTLTSNIETVRGERFWKLMRKMWDYVNAIEWTNSPATRCYQIGDAMASDAAFIRDVWQTRPAWQRDAPLAHRMYAWGITSPGLARMLRDINVRWIYIGADGKKGFTNEWSESHPLIRTLRTCRTHELYVSIGYVLGQRNQDWKDISAWTKFHQRIVREFEGILIVTHGFPLVVAPGSPDWETLLQSDPSFGITDEPDLEAARMAFWKTHTRLCGTGVSPETVRRKLYEMAWEFEIGSHTRGQRTFMLPR